MRRRRHAPLLLLALAFALGVDAARAAAQPGPLAGLDAYIEQALKDWEVPGLALAIVKDDSVIHARGYGVRELGRPDAVDARTLFAIGSASKAFTAALIGMAVEEGKLKWDDAATRHLPGFQLHDPYVTRELTVRDLLTHRSGLARGDLVWYATDYSRAEVLRRARYLEPSWSLRSTFGYQNIMYLAAGEIAAAVHGESWDELVRRRIFEPLGMTESNTSVAALRGRGNVATPHARIDGTVRTVAWRNIDNIAPAGSINSNVLEMAQWIRLQLGEGTYAGRKLWGEEIAREMHTPQMLLRADTQALRLYPEVHFRTYGLGWFLQDYRGRKVVQHGGNIDGMSALVAMLPEEEFGLVVLTNMNGSGLPGALMYRVFDLVLGGPGRDWSAELLAVTQQRMQRAEAQAKQREAARVAGTTPSLPLEAYAGTYADSMYGAIRIMVRDGRLAAEAGPRLGGELEHWHHDTFRLHARDPMLGRFFVTFQLDASGSPAALDVENLAVFRRVRGAASSAADQ